MSKAFDPEVRPDRARAVKFSRIALAVIFFGLAITAAIWLAVGGTGNYGPPPLVMAERSPERLPPDPNKINGADIPHTSQTIYEIVGGGGPQSEKQGIAPAEEKLIPFPVSQPIQSTDIPQPKGPIQLLLPAPEVKQIDPPSNKKLQAKITDPSAADSNEILQNAPALPLPPRRTKATAAADNLKIVRDSLTNSKTTDQSETIKTANLAPSNKFLIQIGAVRSKTIAQKEWRRLREANLDILGGMQLFTREVEIEGRGIFHRMQAGPLPDQTLAEIACGQLKSRGAGCFVVAK